MTSPKAASRRAAAGCDEPRRAAAGGPAGSPLAAGPPLRPAPPPARSTPEAWERRAAPAESAALVRRRSEARLDDMRERTSVGALSVVLILALGLPPGALACPHPCACYVPTEVHCTFRSLAAVPARISKHVERINFGFVLHFIANSFMFLVWNPGMLCTRLTKLELLMIHGNDIQNIPNGALKDLVSLQVFKISYNKLKVITGQTLHGLSSLMRLHVDHNRIEFIHPDAFNGLTSLRLVHLEGNLLQQLHPHTFSTFMVLNYFKLSTVRHLYLSENAISTLPAGMFQGMPLLENLYLHGNPWACDCSLNWLLDWNDNSGGVLKCKKDKAYEGGQLCPRCNSPKQLQKEDIQNLKDISCRKPIIQSSLRHNSSTQDEEDGESYELPLEMFQSSPWNITLNMTDEHGNVVHLNCEIKKPTGSTKIQWSQIQTQEIDINATISLDFECPMNRENYEKLWKLIAYYSEVPVKLERELMLSKEPKISYRYKQGSDYDALYYTGVKAQILSEPSWVMQPLINIQLNRRQSTGKKVVLSFFTVFSQAIHTKDTRQQRSWVMIEQNQSTTKAQSVVEGSECHVNCNVKASERPFIQWLFPDGTKLQAPFNQKDSRFSVLSSGQLVIKPVSYIDAGLYHCIAQVRDDVDVMTYRLLVQPPAIQVADSDIVRVEKNVGDPIVLPCSATASPEAQLNWILPNNQVLNVLSNSSKGYVLDNGTLLIPKSHVSDSGYYRCVAVNQQGSDQFTVRVTVNKMVSDRSFKRIKLKKRTRSKSSSKTRGRVIDDGEGSGTGGIEFPRRKNHLKDREISLKQKSDQVLEAQIKKGKKGRRKMKIWKGADRTQDSNVAEGRRAFESRRRINMANKQINPQHWADILAKVRGKSLPRTTTATAILLTTPLPKEVQKTTPVPHPVAIPLPSETAADVIDSSADVSPPGENEPFSVTVSHSSKAFSTWSAVVGPGTEHFYDQRALKTPASVHSEEIPVSGPIYTTVQPKSQQRQDGRADSSVVVKENMHAVTEGPLTKATVTSYPNIHSSSFTVDSVHAAVSSKSEENSAFAELPLDASVLAESQTVGLHSVLETNERLNEVDQMSVDSIILAPSQLDDTIPTDSVASSAISSTVTVKSSGFIDEHRVLSTGQTEIADLSTTSPAVIEVQSKEESETQSSTVNKESTSSTYAESFQEREQSNLYPPKTDHTFVLPSTNVPHKKTEEITAASISKLTTSATTSAPYRKTTPSVVTQHARKRPYGRRRLRPNRIRQRMKPFPRVLITEAMPVIPRTSEVGAVTKASSAVLEVPDLNSSDKIQGKEEEHREVTPSIDMNPVVLEKMTKTEEVVTTSFFKPTSSQPERKHVALTTTPEALVLPVTESITILSSYIAHNTVPTKESSVPLKPEQNKMAAFDPLKNTSEERSLTADSKAPDSQAELSSTATSEYRSSLISSSKSSYRESQEEAITFHSDILANEATAVTFQSIYPTMTDLSIPSGTLEVFKDVSDSEGLWKPTVFLRTPAITEPPQKQEIESLSSFSTMETKTFLPTETEISIVSRTGEKASSLDKKETVSNVFHHDPTSKTSEKPQTTHNVFTPFTKPFSLPPPISSTFHPSLRYTTRGSNVFNQERLPAVKQVETEDERMVVSSRQNVHPTPFSSQNRIGIQSKEEEFKEIMSKKRTLCLSITFILGALMTANTRLQRFEVLKNGTFLIRNAQLQDRGQYLCTAQNLHGVDKMIFVLTVVAHQPKILLSRYQDVTVYFGDTIAMECQASGSPTPHISWIFPDRKILQTVTTTESRIMLHENRTLSIKQATFSDRGVYKCIASNAAGADSIAVRLHIAALPPIIQQDKQENISLPLGSSINIHCTAKAAPSPSIRWVLFDGTQIRPSQYVNGNLFVFPNGTLYIRNVSPKDSGIYECIAANMVGAARRIIQLHVKKQASNAKITGSSPQRTDVTYGSILHLDCSASGDPWPRILWRLPSKRMIDSLHSNLETRIKVFSNGTLVVHSVTDKDAGDYLCVARNKIGDDYVVLKVNVMMKPAKIEHKNENNHKVKYGGDLKVDCVATGLPNPEISWGLPDGSMINTFMQSDDSGSRTKRYVVFNNGTLYFNDVGLREEGDYTCYAENQIGKDEMKVRVKVVAEPATIRNKTYVIINVPYGDVVTVACEAKGEPTPKVTWLSPTNRPIPTLSEKYQVYRDGTLLIQKAQRSDSGNYTCVVRNSAGEDRKVVWIHVNVQPPRINGHLNAITSVRETAIRDSRKLIDCKAEGIPAPRVLWAFPEGVILPAPYYGNRITVHRNGTLDIRGVRQTDAVQLVCIGRNEGGEARLIVQLLITDHLEKPSFRDPVNERITAIAGHSINLNCSVQGYPEPTTSWILPNGTEVLSGSRLHRFYHKRDGILHISGLSMGDAGTYRCTARNPGGYVERVVFLKVGLRPEISNQYNNLVSIINGETLQLHCITQPNQRAQISWTLPNGMVLDAPQAVGRFSLLENGSLTVREASVFDRGTYLCKVSSDYGTSIMNVPVIVIAYPPRITSEPAPVIYARPGNSVKLNCMAIGIPKAEITWELPDKSHLTTGAQSRLYGNKFLHPQGSLVIQQSSQRDAGFYKCTAKNILGSDSKTTYIHIF
ncbi:hypothetical protein ASZ78_014002 [Callipepla squamata]|uniref:Ig-like domain-containing protein n=1 Tax=Callipepla squamata TaxID=9009 RepID=A0A226NFR0_CALSU|nr:hypothetical protein ASZ78_014002 [Callipepla squamata]